MKYIDLVDKEYVINFIKKQYSNLIIDAKLDIVKCEDYWKITCQKPYDEKDVICVSDFTVVCYPGVFGQQQIVDAWQSSLYQKFGKQYLTDLKDKLISDEVKAYQIKCRAIENKIEALKNNDLTK